MTLTPGLRKFVLTAHVTSSVGWLGAVAGFLVLAIAGLISQDTEIVRAVYLAMKLIGWFVIVPLSFASPLTGLVASLGTMWGLFKHYWVVAKLLMTIPATILLLVHMQPVGHLARVVAETTLFSGDLAGLRLQLVADAGAAIVVLLVTTALSVYKPLGVTRYGRRRQIVLDASGGISLESGYVSANDTPRWMYAFAMIVIALVLLFAILHLTGSHHHGH